MKQLEVLLNQSTKGIHLLFDNDSVSEILQNPTEALEFFTVENLNKIQSLLGDFLQKQSLEDKIHFLRSLEKEDYEILVRSYFNIVDNTILENTSVRH